MQERVAALGPSLLALRVVEDGMWESFVLAFAVTVAVADAWSRKIPRELTTCGLVVGLAYHLFQGGFWSALSTACLAFGLGLGLYELRAIGGGDVKLVSSMGAILGFQHWVLAVEVAITIGGVMALAAVIQRGACRQTFRNMGRLIRYFFTSGLGPHPEIQVKNESLVRVPFGVAAALGTICTVVLR